MPAVRKAKSYGNCKKVKSLTSKEVSYIKRTATAGPSSAKSASLGMTTLKKTKTRAEN